MAFESSIDASLPSPPESLPDTEPWGTTSPAFLALQLFNDTSLPSPPKSLSDTETWGPTSPALLDVLDDPSEGRRQSDIPGEPLRDDLLDDCAESDDFATFGADHGTVASSRMGGQESVFPGPTHLKVEGHDEESFWAFAVKDFFKHNNVNPQERDVHTAVFREFFSMRDDLHHLHLLFETKLFCQIYNESGLDVRTRFNQYLTRLGGAMDEGEMPRFPSEPGWLMRKEAHPHSGEMEELGLCGYLLHLAGGHPTGLEISGYNDDDVEMFANFCQLVDKDFGLQQEIGAGS